ncbi:MAG: DNA repair protein RecN [Bacteroidales bacterium]
MINYLIVKNYALIDSLEIEFNHGLSIITGETGAGKSILLGALALILGQRADSSVLRNKELKCIVEGSFSIAGYQLEDFFQLNEIDYEPVAILRREINQAGKSRAFINDTPVNLNVLSELGIKLVDIHSQHQNLELNDSAFQLKIIDTYAGNSDQKEKYSSQFKIYQGLKKSLENLVADSSRSKEDFDYYRFQHDELDKARLVDGEQELLENEMATINHAEEIQKNLVLIFGLLSENQPSVISSLVEASKAAAQAAVYLPGMVSLAERLESTGIETKDIAAEIEKIAGNVHFDPERSEFVNDRLGLIYTLQKKHKVQTVKDLLSLKTELFKRINDIEFYDEKLKSLAKECENERKRLLEIGISLSDKRKSCFEDIQNYVVEQLKSLGIPNAVFRITAEKTDDFTPSGIDKINFLFSANKNSEISNISKVASGGEISRLMLSIKSLLSKSAALPCIIFDEIDSGVSGEIAYKMGSIMLQMSEFMQVISITHLPQVAAKGNTHYLVYKQEASNHTATLIKKLNPEERLFEIAKMLSGENLSKEALENARVLLNN